MSSKGKNLSHYVVKPPPPRRPGWSSAVGAALFLTLLALASAWSASRPITVKIDGRNRRVPAHSTVGQALDAGWLACTPGDLVGVDGSIVEYGAGQPATVIRNGSPTDLEQRLYPGDVIGGLSGSNKRESLVTTRVAVPFKTRYEGEGSLTTIKTLGAPGARTVTRGERSGFEITSTVLVEPADMVIARHRPANGRLVALTFDDGPFPGQTERVLKTLKDHNVKATFFMLGIQIRRNPALARRVVREGHAVGSHTYGHGRLDLMSPQRSRIEIQAGSRELRTATHVSSRWLRPPYGGMDYSAWKTIRGLNMYAVMWDVDSRDWTRPGAPRIAATVLRDTRPGSVVLMHDGGGDRIQTVQALNIIIPRLKRAGYTFVTVDELADARNEAAKRATVRKVSRKANQPRKGGG